MSMTRATGVAVALAVLASVGVAQESKDKAVALADGQPVAVAPTSRGSRWYRFDATERGPYALTIARTTSESTAFRIVVRRDGDRGAPYSYQGHAKVDHFRFYPVLEKGTYRFEVTGRDGADLRLTLARNDCKLADADRAAALAAIARACDFLASARPEKPRGSYPVAVEGLVLAALAEETSPERRALVDASWVSWLEKLGDERKDPWDGRKVNVAGSTLYELSIATLGLAEAAANGSEKARALLPRYVECVLAAQVSPRRPKEWGTIAEGARDVGGWRYHPNVKDADISVSGWSVIALTAASVAGVEPDGIREGLRAGVDYVLRCHDKKGYVYQLGAGANGDIRDAIGALIALLEGQESDELDGALESLDRHLSAFTQTDDGEDYPLYYAYYATRVHYLRGGYAWQAWRTTMLRQLLENQTASGTWPLFGGERDPGDRYAAALGAMILRMCLEQVPSYLKDEVRGF